MSGLSSREWFHDDLSLFVFLHILARFLAEDHPVGCKSICGLHLIGQVTCGLATNPV
jgi:hypothetical protein